MSHEPIPDILRLELLEKRLTTVEKLLTSPTGGDVYYQHSQNFPSATWIINHGLGRFPNVRVVDSAGNTIDGEIQDVDVNSLTVKFFLGNSPYALIGKAFCS